jgi:hypothetical protein
MLMLGTHKHGLRLVALLMAGALLAQTSHAQLSKATQILLNRGVELQAMVQYADEFNLSTYTNANYTSVNWLDPSWNPELGPVPGFPWGRWVSSQADMPPQNVYTQYGYNDETPYMSQLIDLELGDELNLNDGPTLTNEINWFNSVQSSFPNTILYINNYEGQVSDNTLSNMINQGHCDMICFDFYPFQSTYDTNYPNDIGAPNNCPFTEWLSDLRRYRQDAMNYGPVPFAAYMDIFNSVESYDTRVYRDPSAPELRFNNFSALAFNAKMLIGFEYNAGAAALFNILPNGYSGDTYTNALYGEQADVNHRATILGRSLSCMKPVYDLHNLNDANPPPGPASAYTTFPDGITTSILILKGSPGTTNSTPEPSGFAESPSSSNYSWWEFKANDPYFNGWVVSNPGTNNGGAPGQVIISWFTPLEANLEGANHTNEVYVMVVNALTANTGSETNCMQTIKLNLSTGTNITAVEMLDLEAGVVTTNVLPVIAGNGSNSSTKRQLVLNLNGGDAAFFKYADGTPFVGHVTPAAPKLSASMQGGFPAITVQGTPLARYQLQSAPALTGANWSVVSNCLFTNSSTVFFDSSGSSTNSTFYRAAGIP